MFNQHFNVSQLFFQNFIFYQKCSFFSVNPMGYICIVFVYHIKNMQQIVFYWARHLFFIIFFCFNILYFFFVSFFSFSTKGGTVTVKGDLRETLLIGYLSLLMYRIAKGTGLSKILKNKLFLTENSFLAEILIFDRNFNFSRKFLFFTESSIFHENFRF